MGALILFGLVLAVMGGGIAYAGDRLGSYIGKKRHSSFGLRPRHTAMLWTVVSGGGVAVLTLLLFLALNHAFGVALVRYPQLLAANARLTGQNRALAKQGGAAERRAQDDSRRAAEARSQADQAQARATLTEARAARTQAALAAVAGRLAQARAGLTGARQLLAARQAALASAQARLAEARAGLGTTRAELTRAVGQVREARASVTEARANVASARRRLQGAEAQVTRASRSVLSLAIRQDQLRFAQDALGRENATLTRQNAALARQNAAQRELLAASQGRPLVLRREEELGRVVVAAGRPPAALRRALAVFLDRVELTARQRGAGGADSAAAIVVPAPDGDGGASAREAALDALSESIAAQAGALPSIVVVASARYNTFKGEAVPVDLRPYANLLVFPRGQVIARGAVDGGLPEDEVLKRLERFLTGPVRAAALQRGLIPLRDPQSGEPQVGEPISSAESLALVRRIREAGPDARLTAGVAQDTYSADLLRLTLSVTPAPRR